MSNASISTFAGTGVPGADGDGGPATLALLLSPRGVAFGPGGVVYVADWGNHRLRVVDASGVITTLAGDGRAGSEGDGGPASLARLNEPTGLALDAGGSVFVSEVAGGRVRRIDASSGLITTVAGRGPALPFQPLFAGDGGPATLAQLQSPWGLAFSRAEGALLVADRLNNRIRRVDMLGGIITTVAGRAGFPFHCGDGSYAIDADVDSPSGLTLYEAAGNQSGNLFLSSAGSSMTGPFASRHRVRRIRGILATSTPSFGSTPTSTFTELYSPIRATRSPTSPSSALPRVQLPLARSQTSLDLLTVVLCSVAISGMALLLARTAFRAAARATPLGSAEPRAHTAHQMPAAAKAAARHAAAAVSALAPVLGKREVGGWS